MRALLLRLAVLGCFVPAVAFAQSSGGGGGSGNMTATGSWNAGDCAVATATGASGAVQYQTGVCGPGGGLGSFATANGFAGTLVGALGTISTTVTGIVKGNGTALSAATAGTDYLTPTGSGAGLTALNASAINSGVAGVGFGGTGLTVGTSGGILAFTASGTLASSGLLTNNAIVLGGGSGAVPKSVGSAWHDDDRAPWQCWRCADIRGCQPGYRCHRQSSCYEP